MNHPPAVYLREEVLRDAVNGWLDDLFSRAMASQYLRLASREVLRIRWITQVWVMAIGQVASIAWDSPFRPSQTTMQQFSTPRLLISVSTCSQNFAPSLPWPTHKPRMSRSPSTVTPTAV